MGRWMISALGVVAVGMAAGGCGKNDAKVAEEMVEMMEQMATIADEQKDDCDTMGERLHALVSAKKELIEQAKRIKADPKRARALGGHRDRVQAAGKKMLGGLLKCGTNPKVREAIKPTLLK